MVFASERTLLQSLFQSISSESIRSFFVLVFMPISRTQPVLVNVMKIFDLKHSFIVLRAYLH